MKTEETKDVLIAPTISGAVSMFKNVNCEIEQFKQMFSVNAEQLLPELNKFAKVVTSNMFENICFKIEPNRVELIGTNIELTLKTVLIVPTKGAGIFYANFKDLIKYVKAVKSGPLVFDYLSDSNVLNIHRDGSIYKMIAVSSLFNDEAGENNANYEINEMGKENIFTITSDGLLNVIKKTLPFVGSDELRPVMTGVNIQAINGEIIGTGTDAHKLATYRLFDNSQYNVSNQSSFIIPSDGCKVVLSLFNGSGMVNISADDETAIFKHGKTVLSIRLINGKYVDYSAVIPKDNDKELKVNRKHLIDVLNRCLTGANKETNMLRLECSVQHCNVVGQDVDLNKEVSESLKCDYVGDGLTIGVNGKLLLQILNEIRTETVCFYLKANNRAVLIMPYELSVTDDYLTLIMPVMLN